MYEEVPDWLVSRLSRVPIVAPSFHCNGSGQAVATHEGDDPPIINESSSVNVPTERLAISPEREITAVIRPEVGAATVECAADARLSVGSSDSNPAGPSFSPDSPMRDPLVVATAVLAEMAIGHAPELALFNSGAPGERFDNLHPENTIQVLTRLAAGARLFRSADGRYCGQVRSAIDSKIYGLRSAGFRDWLIDGFLNEQSEPPSSWAIRRVVGMLEARARFNTGIPEVFVRVGQGRQGRRRGLFPRPWRSQRPGHRDSRSRGWSVVDRPGVHFRRPEGLLPLPMPARDGSIDLLRPYVNLTEPDFRLMIAWLTAVLRPVGPYPVLVLNGEQASGKSTLARILRLLIDPQTCPVLALPKSTHDLMATAVNGWLLVYENISTIAGWLSDCICQLAFGGGFASRTLFTNDERSVIFAQRPVILVGIDDFVLRGDLRDRSVFLHLPAIPARPPTNRAERSGRRFARIIRGFWVACSTRSPAACASCRRST